MNEELDEFVEQQLEKFKNKDILVHYERGTIKVTYGFFTWSEHGHVRTTLSELLENGFEKSDIKELRDEAKKILIIEKLPNEFEMIEE